MTLKRQDEIGSAIIHALETTWQEIRTRHHDVPVAVMITGAGSSPGPRRGLRLGHFAATRWQTDTGEIAEIFVGGEGLARGSRAVLATLLHEAAHAIAHARQIQDTSRQGRYHNQRFRAIAEGLGLQIEHHPTLGWSPTTITNATVLEYHATLDILDQALSSHREREQADRPRPGGRNLAPCRCACGRRIRVAPTVLAQAAITCSACGQPFRTVQHQPADALIDG